MKPASVDAASGPDHPFPPAAGLRFPRPDAGDMRISRERVADENDIILSHRRAAFFVRNLDFLQNAARLEPVAPFRQLEFELFRLNYAYSVIHCA